MTKYDVFLIVGSSLKVTLVYLRRHLNRFAHVHLTYNYDVSPNATHVTHFFISNIISSCLDKFHNNTTCLALGTKPRRWTVPSNAGNTLDHTLISIGDHDGQQEVDH